MVCQSMTLENIARHPLGPQRMTLESDRFQIAYALEQAGKGAGGTILLRQMCNVFDPHLVFFAPKGESKRFFELNVSLRASYQGEKCRFFFDAQPDRIAYVLDVHFEKAAELLCGNKRQPYQFLPRRAVDAINQRIYSGDLELFSLPLERKVDEAVALSKSVAGVDGVLALTLPRYQRGLVYRAFIVPDDPSQRTRDATIESVSRFDFSRGSEHITCELRLKLVEPSVDLALGPFGPDSAKGALVNKKQAKILSPEEVDSLIEDGRIPGVLKNPLPLISPCPAR